MSSDGEKHVFVSYVHEDSQEVEKLCEVLAAARIPYWRDRNSLGPGDAWKAKIRQAIQGGSLVFLACFSENSRTKAKSHMNEELTLAVEEYRKMPPGRTWLIPVRFDSGDVPEWDLGAGRTLSDLNYADLFGDKYAAQAASLVTTVHGVMGEKRLSPASALEAVEKATSADRADLLKRLTKEMLVDPTRRIELDDIISQEVQNILKAITSSDRVSGPLQGTGDEQVVQLATQAREIWDLTKPFCASLQVAARWGNPELVAPWASGMRSFVQAALKQEAGNVALLNLRHLPGVLSLITASLAAGSARKWDNVRTLMVEPSVRDPYRSTPRTILEATEPWAPFENAVMVANALAKSEVESKPLDEALSEFTENRVGKYHTPVAEWFHSILRSIFVDQIPDQDAYSSEFDRAEVLLGVLAQDAEAVRLAASGEGQRWYRSHWYGRSTWRSTYSHGHPVDDMLLEIDTERERWGPLRAGLFGGDQARARKAIEDYGERFNSLSRSRF